MKIIEALKKIKDLQRKADDIKVKVSQYCADLDCETPVYPDQKRQISEWLQSHSDIIKEILHLRVSIQRTNLNTMVSIDVGEKSVKKSIAEWIHRRKDLAFDEQKMWKNLREKHDQDTFTTRMTSNSPEITVKRRLYFDPVLRDKKIEEYRNEPHAIDAALEVVNAVTDLIEQ